MTPPATSVVLVFCVAGCGWKVAVPLRENDPLAPYEQLASYDRCPLCEVGYTDALVQR